MNSFLEDVAASVVQQYGSDLSKLEVILPTNRAAIYLKSAFSTLDVKPPRTTTIDKFIHSLSPEHSTTHNFVLVALLYDVYQKSHKEQSFEEFYSFGKLILSDFDAIDKYLVDAKALYSIVSHSKELDYTIGLDDEAKRLATEFWKNVDYKGEKSNHEREFARVWHSLYSIYQEFNELLDLKQLTYNGKIYRIAAERISELENLDSINPRHLIFVGLNALSRSEEVVLLKFLEQGKADFIWDYDTEWQRFNSIEASYFIERNLALMPQAQYFKNSKSETSQTPSINIIPSTIDSAQVKIATSIIENEILAGNSLERTAIILPDESLITPLLYSLCPKIGKLNISIGYPLNATALAPLLETLILLKNRAKRDPESPTGGYLFYHKDIESILAHSYISPLFTSKLEPTGENYSRKVYYSFDELILMVEGADFLFSAKSISLRLSEYLELVCNRILEHFTANQDSESSTEQQLCITKAIEVLRQVDLIIKSTPLDISNSLYIKLLKGELNKHSLEFEGYSGAGLQIIGILESRALDFDKVIMLSLSDDIFPASKPENSYIPQLLLQGYGMPTVADKSAIWSYYFYRLLQRSSSMSLIYCNNTSGLSSGEPSRYIMQLKYSLPYQISEQEVSYSEISASFESQISVKRSDEIVKELKNRRFYPSQLNQYIKCPLSFYFKYIAALKEPEEELAQNTAILTGNLVHNTLEKLYEPLVNKLEVASIISKITNQEIIDSLDIVISKTLPQSLLEETASLDIMRQTALRMIQGIVRYDSESQELESIVALEKTLKAEIREFEICGKIDRIDRLRDKSIRVIDYKSGKVELEFDSLEQLFELNYLGKKKRDGALQLLLYSYLARENYPCDISAALLSTRSLASLGKVEENHGVISIAKTPIKKLTVENFEEIKELTSSLLENLCDKEIDFQQTTNPDSCTYCSYRSICR